MVMLRCLSILCFAVVAVGCADTAVQRPNVVLIVIDTLRADGLSVNGHAVALTPNIDGLAAEGVNFTAAYAHSTWTKPSMATLFTGAFADRHLVRTPVEEVEGRMVAARLGPQLHTLAERL